MSGSLKYNGQSVLITYFGLLANPGSPSECVLVVLKNVLFLCTTNSEMILKIKFWS